MLSLAAVRRIVRLYLPDAYIQSTAKLPAGVLGASWLCDDTPMILYSRRQSRRQQVHTILHELAHHLYDIPRGGHRVATCEERADRLADEMIAMLAAC